MLVGRCLTRWLTRFRWRRIGRLTSGMDTGSRTVITDLHDRDAGTSPPPPPLLHSVRMKIIIFTHSNDRARHGYVSPSMPIVYHLQCCWFNDYSLKLWSNILFIFSIPTWRRCRSVRSFLFAECDSVEGENQFTSYQDLEGGEGGVA